MKKLLEVLVCIFLHPLAVILAWINLAGRNDIGTGQKVAWAIFVIFPIVPIVYVLASGDLW